MPTLTLTTRLEPFGPAGAFELTDAQVAHLGGGKRAPVRVTVGDRRVPLRLAVMGGKNVIGVSKANRAALGVEIGDEVTVVIAADETPRTVDVPAELAAALAADEAAAAAFEGLAYTHRKEFATWVASAKREATRERRVTETLTMLHDGRTRS